MFENVWCGVCENVWYGVGKVWLEGTSWYLHSRKHLRIFTEILKGLAELKKSSPLRFKACLIDQVFASARLRSIIVDMCLEWEKGRMGNETGNGEINR